MIVTPLSAPDEATSGPGWRIDLDGQIHDILVGIREHSYSLQCDGIWYQFPKVASRQASRTFDIGQHHAMATLRLVIEPLRVWWRRQSWSWAAVPVALNSLLAAAVGGEVSADMFRDRRLRELVELAVDGEAEGTWVGGGVDPSSAWEFVPPGIPLPQW